MNDETRICNDIMRNIQETKEARAKMVSELRTMPPCLDTNCPDHSTLETKANDLSKQIEIDKSILHVNDTPLPPEKEKIAKITRMTLSFQIKLYDIPPQLQYFNQLMFKIISLTYSKTLRSNKSND
ncbi:hypothetical protein TNCV_747961 [Trichonephila clavipes]|nr:hypothetical protein TNCV_747961 [Trichonephila clavipes]